MSETSEWLFDVQTKVKTVVRKEVVERVPKLTFTLTTKIAFLSHAGQNFIFVWRTPVRYLATSPKEIFVGYMRCTNGRLTLHPCSPAYVVLSLKSGIDEERVLNILNEGTSSVTSAVHALATTIPESDLWEE